RRHVTIGESFAAGDGSGIGVHRVTPGVAPLNLPLQGDFLREIDLDRHLPGLIRTRLPKSGADSWVVSLKSLMVVLHPPDEERTFLELLRSFPEVERLTLHTAEVTPQTLRECSRLKSLSRLSIVTYRMTGGLTHLQGLPALTSLSIHAQSLSEN